MLVLTSDQAFGRVFSIFFFLISILPLLKHHHPRWWSIPVAVIFFLLAEFRPHWLTRLKNAWLKLGAILHHITSPIIMGILYFFIITPIGIGARLLGKDLLQLEFDRNTKTYWKKRSAIITNMKNQF